MRVYLDEFCTEHEYSKEAHDMLCAAYDRLCLNDKFNELLKEFYENSELTAEEIEQKLDKISAESSVHKYTTALLYYILLSKQLKEEYIKAGISEEIFYNSMADLGYKAVECYNVYGIWGSFVSPWFYGFFRLTRFALGRMQYERAVYNGEDVCIFGKLIQKGQRVIACHIPSSGESFDKQARDKSYKMAAKFFGTNFDEDIIFMCESWLLYPKNKIILKNNLNMMSFMDDFVIVSSDESENGDDLWRVFNKMYDGCCADLPEDTSMQRAYKSWLMSGNKVGGGTGLFVYKK